MSSWEVVGGADKGGILVRSGIDLKSESLGRLSCGAQIEELELKGDRLNYKKLTGDGPGEGWISIKLKDKELARRIPGKPTKQDFDPYKILGISPEATDAQIKSAFRKASLRVHPDQNPDDPDAAARFRELTEARDFLLSPLKRFMYNVKHGYKPRRDYIKWWSDWDEIFDEIDGAEEDDEGDATVSLPSSPSLESARTDVLVFGATGQVGTVVMGFIRRHLPGRTWAIAGRDERKLLMLENKFGKGQFYRGKLQVKGPDDIESIVRTARIVIDVSGAKWPMGGIVPKACVRAGTHLIDNTSFGGDTLATRPVFEDLAPKAKAAGVSLLMFCGAGTVVYDFATWVLVRYLRDRYGAPTRRVDGYELAQSGMITGSVLLAAKGQDDYEKELKKQGYFFLGGIPKGGLQEEDDEDKYQPVQDPYVTSLWRQLSEIPELICTRCSYGLSSASHSYGDNFRFKIWNLFGDKAQAQGNALRIQNKFLRRGYEKHVELKKIPGPGQGPCERMRKEALITRILVAEADNSQSRKAHVVSQPGPGGLSDHVEGTAVIVLAAASCFLDALDAEGKGAVEAGIGTPVHHLASLGFLERLAALGFTFKVHDGAPAPELFLNAMSAAGALQG